MIMSRDFSFEAGHHLNNYNGACSNPHGHSYTGTLNLKIFGNKTSQLSEKTGMFVDFNDMKNICKIVERMFDHKYLNHDLPFFEKINPTAEFISAFIFITADILLQKYNVSENVSVDSIELKETQNSKIIFSYEDLENFIRPKKYTEYKELIIKHLNKTIFKNDPIQIEKTLLSSILFNSKAGEVFIFGDKIIVKNGKL